jgi:signal transduction histidine kinase
MNFKFATGILIRLGEELISNPEHGLIELVKNSYDADATDCTVELKGTNHLGGAIIIRDDGTGMDLKAIDDGWFLIGSSKKSSQKLTQLGRQPAGNKGLGRIAALRLGNQVRLVTRPKDEPGIEYSLIINWEDFEKVDVVEAITFEPKSNKTDLSHGTEIIIENLQVKLGRSEIEKLARELILLADPFSDKIGFHPKLIAAEFTDLEKQVRNAYFDNAEYHLKAQVDKEGLAEAWVLDWQGKVRFHAKHQKLTDQPYRTAPATFDLWVFLLNAPSFSSRKASISEVRDWISVVGGVRLYHRGLRVRPYGDPGHDWLSMNLARARDPEERPSTNTSVGVVFVNDSDDVLVQKTDRIGFVETEAFSELQRFAIDVMEWMHRERLRIRSERQKKERVEAPKKTAAAKASVERIVEATIPEDIRPKVRKALYQYEQAKEREVRILREDLQLYRGMATAGVTAAVFAHEAGKPITHIIRAVKIIEKKGRQLLGEAYSSSLEKPITSLHYSAEMIKNYALLPLHLLNRSKRRSGVIDVKSVIEELITIFNPFLIEPKIQLIYEKTEDSLHIQGSISLLEVILTNFLTNSINAFTKVEGAPIEDRKIIIRTEITDTQLFRKTLLLRVFDNGLGIVNIDPKEIWMPGRTTQTDGTGFGLTIVKDSVADLGGNVRAISRGELGGAEFIVELPLIEGDQDAAIKTLI